MFDPATPATVPSFEAYWQRVEARLGHPVLSTAEVDVVCEAYAQGLSVETTSIIVGCLHMDGEP